MPTTLFIGGYLLVWIGFSVAAMFLQALLRDERTDEAQRAALQLIWGGQAGGPP